MAILAGCHHMQADQRKFAEAVIKSDIVAPGYFSVTVSAILPKASFVYVLLFMAINACHRKLRSEGAMMAILAGGICMRPKKWEPGILCMIELRSLPPINRMA